MTITDRLQYFQQLGASSPATDTANKETPSRPLPAASRNATTTTTTTDTTTTTAATTGDTINDFLPLKERLRRYQQNASTDAAATPASNGAKGTATVTTKAIVRPFERANKVAAASASVASTPSNPTRPITVKSSPTSTAATARAHDDSPHIRIASAAAFGPLSSRVANYTASAVHSAPSATTPNRVTSHSNPNLDDAGRKKCEVCSKTVYLMEEVAIDNKSFHKTCLKCTHCHSTLRMGNLAAMNGHYYCKPHFKELFHLKGNYSEGFGAEDPKKNWVSRTEEHATGSHTTPAAAGGISTASARLSTTAGRAVVPSSQSQSSSPNEAEGLSLQERLQRYASTAAATNAEKGISISSGRRSVTTRDSVTAKSVRASVSARESNAVSGSIRASVAQRESVSGREKAQAKAFEREEARGHASFKGGVNKSTSASVTCPTAAVAPQPNVQQGIPEPRTSTGFSKSTQDVVSGSVTINEQHIAQEVSLPQPAEEVDTLLAHEQPSEETPVDVEEEEVQETNVEEGRQQDKRIGDVSVNT
ncbi:hypothetical protein SeMB42_g06231 [Synchytrium endobioticum]|uniref:LIM zinc-binding domain-containing protein n=1 Tax=Synchytrium endobioticum TaxID=286115 RepID=A0A507CQE8_9FUNG|nr:hypothetical protein SeMB42_g06231 [Synchytrium endobioticum]TPX41354.1 hypothetical protein SeLEV6574_g06133 [Synchytrium endobioticum]